jgi:hypothetical protein
LTRLSLFGLLFILVVWPHVQQVNANGVVQQTPAPAAWTSFRFEFGDDGSGRIATWNYLQADEKLAEYLLDYFARTRQLQLKTMRELLSVQEFAIRERLGRAVQSSEMTFDVFELGHLVVLEEKWIWSGFCSRQFMSWVADAFAAIPITLARGGNLTIILPRGVQPSSVNPPEDTRISIGDRVSLVFLGPRENLSPSVKYQTYLDTLVTPSTTWPIVAAMLGILAVSIVALILVVRTVRGCRLKQAMRSEPKFCLQCGSPLRGGSNFCLRCGAPTRRAGRTLP